MGGTIAGARVGTGQTYPAFRVRVVLAWAGVIYGRRGFGLFAHVLLAIKSVGVYTGVLKYRIVFKVSLPCESPQFYDR